MSTSQLSPSSPALHGQELACGGSGAVPCAWALCTGLQELSQRAGCGTKLLWKTDMRSSSSVFIEENLKSLPKLRLCLLKD